MKSIRSKEKCEVADWPFPKLQISSVSGCVYLMGTPTTGLCVSTSVTSHTELGEYNDDIPRYNMSDYVGSVCLENGA